jgi:hypothetical protein
MAFSIPILWMTLISARKNFTPKATLVTGLILLSVILVTQGDSRRVPQALVLPNSSGPFGYPQASDLEFAESGVILALKNALAQEPDHIFCVSDYGLPVPNAEESLDSYFCTRWGQTFTSSETSAWRFVPLGLQAVNDLDKVRDTVKNESVVVIRIPDPTQNPSELAEISNTWWGQHVDPGWKILVVR